MAQTGTTRKAAAQAAAEDAHELDELQALPGERRWPRPWMGPFLTALSTIPDISSASRAVQVGRRTVYRWRDDDPAFREAWDEAIQIARDKLESYAHSWATVGVPVRSSKTRTTTKVDREGNTVETTTETVVSEGAERSATLMIFWLKAHYPERYRWADRIETSGPDGSAIQVESIESIDRQIEKLAAEIAARGHGQPVPQE